MNINLTVKRGLEIRSECVRVIIRIIKEKLFFHEAVEISYGKFKDLNDRKFIGELVRGVLRWKGTLEFLLRAMSEKPFLPFKREEDRIAVLCGMYQIFFEEKVPDYASIDCAVELVKSGSGNKAASFANAILRRCSRAGSFRNLIDELFPGRERDAIWASYPKWLRRKLEKSLGTDVAYEQASAMNERADVFVRVDGIDFNKVSELMIRENPDCIVEKGRWLPSCIVIRKGGNIRDWELYRRGYITVQDEGSQIAAVALGALPSSKILDCCCGIGIKTGQIARQLDGGRLISFDINKGKIRLLKCEMKRLNVDCVDSMCADALKIPVKNSIKFDRIIIDAPCTGTGSMSRKPDIKYRIKLSDPDRLSMLQRQIIQSAAAYLKKGGVMIYSVCSLLEEEGRKPIEDFLAVNSEFKTINPPGLPPELMKQCVNGTLVLLPSVHGTEGFYITALTNA